MKCPICGRDLEIREKVVEIPYFGKVLLFSVYCPNCGFKKADVQILENKGKIIKEFKVKNKEDLNSMVIRSSEASIRIPELGLDLDPGVASQGFITTVEGVLYRFLDIARMIERWSERDKDYEKLEKVRQKIKEIQDAIEGKINFTLIIEDPTGNSTIIPKKY